MKCTACNSTMTYKGGKNTKDNGCWNKDCPARIEACYYGNVSVVPNWWFAEKYHLPFKSGAQWYCVVGPENGFVPKRNTSPFVNPRGTIGGQQITSLKRIDTFYTYGILDWNKCYPIGGDVLTCSQTEIWTTPYMALPVNEDFNREFEVLLKRFDRYLNKLIVLK